MTLSIELLPAPFGPMIDESGCARPRINTGDCLDTAEVEMDVVDAKTDVRRRIHQAALATGVNILASAIRRRR
jgi:hypothetical protein